MKWQQSTIQQTSSHSIGQQCMSAWLSVLHFVEWLTRKREKAIESAWWIETTTDKPQCTYYFGPFHDFAEASSVHFGFIQDLIEEGAQGITSIVKRCNPETLTIYEPEPDSSLSQSAPTRSPTLVPTTPTLSTSLTYQTKFTKPQLDTPQERMEAPHPL